MASVGGIKDVPDSNSLDIEAIARFAVEDHNKKQNAILEFVRVVHAKQQLVAGTMYYLTLEVMDGGVKKHYEAKIWEKVWLNFKEVQEFKLVSGGASESSA